MRKLICILLALIAFATPATAHAACGKGGRVLGMILGGVAGGLLGSKIDGGRRNTAGLLIGGAVGALAGGAIGKALDKCEKEKLGKATEASLNSPASGAESTANWKSDSRPEVTGTVSASEPVQQPDGRICRSVTRVNYVQGQEMQDAPTFCKTPPSSAWVAT